MSTLTQEQPATGDGAPTRLLSLTLALTFLAEFGSLTSFCLFRLAGYSVVVADDMDDALAIVKGCPALQVGGGIEVGTVMEVD